MALIFENTYANGYLERKTNGGYEGEISIEGVDLSPIVGIFFKEKGKQYLWLKRKKIVDYDHKQGIFVSRSPSPYWETYLGTNSNQMSRYKGEFFFFHVKFNIYGIWDGIDKKRNRMNFFIDRVPMSEQTIINNINKKNNRKDDRPNQ